MHRSLLFLSIAVGAVFFSPDDGCKIPTVMAAEEDSALIEGRVNVLGSVRPKYTHRQSVTKVKEILQTMQAREEDFAEAYETFIKKFSDKEILSTEKMDIIDPFWLRLCEAERPTGSTARERLRDQKQRRNATIKVMESEFQEQLNRSRNAIRGFGALIGLCDEYLEAQNQEKITYLLDSLISSHLLNLNPTINNYMPAKETNIYSHISLKKDEINSYYTQDSRLAALSQLYYIIDYVRPIDILIKAGVQPEAKEWEFAETVQQYVKGNITLDDPSVFLIDGFLYHKGIEKAKSSLAALHAISTLNRHINTGGVLDADVEVEPLLTTEKEKAKKHYNVLYNLHRSRVDSHIRGLRKEDHVKLLKSASFLDSALSGESEYAISEKKEEDVISTKPPRQKGEKKRSRHNKKNKSHPHAQQKSELSRLPQSIEENTLSNNKTLTLSPVSPTPKIDSKEQLSLEDLHVSDAAPISQEKTAEVQLNINNRQEEVMTPQKDSIIASPKFLLPKNDNNVIAKQPPTISTLVPKKEIKEATTLRKGKHWATLEALTNLTEKPFTISYVEALNAMSKIDIVELPPKKGGDFRKLVRYDAHGKISGRIASYKPATSTIGRELMKIYRHFIAQQLEDRHDFNLS